VITDLDCEKCGTDDFVSLVEVLPDQRLQVRCRQCGAEWIRGTAAHVAKGLPTLAETKARFPGPDDVDPAHLSRAAALKEQFLLDVPVQDPAVTKHWTKYQHIFSAAGLPTADPLDLKHFANSSVGAGPGNMSVFNTAWNQMGPEAAAAQVRSVVDHLLSGPSSSTLEDRLTQLIVDDTSIGMKGFKEALLTKVLCVMEPDRFLPILTYTGSAGKREIARSIYGLELPDPAKVTWTIGRLIVWSNDLLLALLGDGFQSTQHASAFLWWAKDQSVDDSTQARSSTCQM
jgi:hypothetical protein